MKSLLQYLLLFQLFYFIPQTIVNAQTEKSGKLLRVYEDNDYLNIRGKGTDKAYTAGTRLDIFYHPKKRLWMIPRFLTGDKANNIYEGEWGLMQMLFTPNNISVTYFQPKDYFYSGALFVMHSLYCYNPSKHFSFKTELLAGIRGPAAFGEQTQTFIHRMIHYTLPQGWNNQLKNSPLANINLTLEKQLASNNNWVELIGGAKVLAGTLQNGLSFYPIIRFGLMNGYFNGYFSQFSGTRKKRASNNNKIQAYFIVKPEMQFVLDNSLIEGGVFAKTPNIKLADGSSTSSSVATDCSVKSINHLVYSIGYGAVVTTGKLGLSFIQNASTESKKGTYSHEVGNLSIYFVL